MLLLVEPRQNNTCPKIIIIAQIRRLEEHKTHVKNQEIEENEDQMNDESNQAFQHRDNAPSVLKRSSQILPLSINFQHRIFDVLQYDNYNKTKEWIHYIVMLL